MTRTLVSLALSCLATLLFAASAKAQLPGVVKVRGEIVSVDVQAASFELKTLSGHVITVQTGEKTRIVVDGQPAKIDQLEPGMRAGVEGRKDPLHKVLRAFRVRAFTPPGP